MKLPSWHRLSPQLYSGGIGALCYPQAFSIFLPPWGRTLVLHQLATCLLGDTLLPFSYADVFIAASARSVVPASPPFAMARVSLDQPSRFGLTLAPQAVLRPVVATTLDGQLLRQESWRNPLVCHPRR